MALNRLDFGTVPNPVPGDWALLSELVSKAFQNINVPLQVVNTDVPQGATFQIGGVIYYGTTDTTITGTPSDYVKLTPNIGDSGATCDAAFVVNLTGVIWNKIYNGYYDVSGNLYIFDEALAILDAIITTSDTKISQAVEDVAQSVTPIGFVYTQYPGKDSPATLGLVGTWTNISSEFAGDFFRAEGGDASTFESGQQGDAIRNITGSASNDYETGLLEGSEVLSGAFERGTSRVRELDRSLGIGYDLNFDASNVVPTAVENRPVNRTIVLWERTA